MEILGHHATQGITEEEVKREPLYLALASIYRTSHNSSDVDAAARALGQIHQLRKLVKTPETIGPNIHDLNDLAVKLDDMASEHLHEAVEAGMAGRTKADAYSSGKSVGFRRSAQELRALLNKKR
jgi:hypothetical protein